MEIEDWLAAQFQVGFPWGCIDGRKCEDLFLRAPVNSERSLRERLQVKDDLRALSRRGSSAAGVFQRGGDYKPQHPEPWKGLWGGGETPPPQRHLGYSPRPAFCGAEDVKSQLATLFEPAWGPDMHGFASRASRRVSHTNVTPDKHNL